MGKSSTSISAPINTPIDCKVLDHLNKTSSLNTTTLPLSDDSSLARFLTRWCCSSPTISEGRDSIKKIKVIASKGSYKPLCGSRQIQTRGKKYSLD